MKEPECELVNTKKVRKNLDIKRTIYSSYRSMLDDRTPNELLIETHALCELSAGEDAISKRASGLNKLWRLVIMFKPSELQSLNIKLLLDANIICMSVFVTYPPEMDQSKRCFEATCVKLAPELSREVAAAVAHLLTERRMWSNDLFCQYIYKKLRYYRVAHCHLISELTHAMENVPSETISDSIHIIRLMYVCTQHIRLPIYEDEAKELALKGLALLYKVLDVKLHTRPVHRYPHTRKALLHYYSLLMEVMSPQDRIGHMIVMLQWLNDPDVSDRSVTDINDLVIHAAVHHPTRLFKDTLIPPLMNPLLSLLQSERANVSRLANMCLQRIIDRHGNLQILKEPVIYFPDSTSYIKKAVLREEDREFLRLIRRKFHRCLLAAFLEHILHQENVVACYVTLCLLLAEVPCGYTVAMLVCFVGHVQQIALERQSFTFNSAAHIHATIIAVMSLIAYLTKSNDLYSYLLPIVSKRALTAPYLNPPLRLSYSLHKHHTLWTNSELLLADWDVRYYVWLALKSEQVGESNIENDFQDSALQLQFTYDTAFDY